MSKIRIKNGKGMSGYMFYDWNGVYMLGLYVMVGRLSFSLSISDN